MPPWHIRRGSHFGGKDAVCLHGILDRFGHGLRQALRGKRLRRVPDEFEVDLHLRPPPLPS